MKLLTILVASSPVRHVGFGQPVVNVELEDFVELLECEVVEVVVRDAVEDVLELLRVVEEVTEVMVGLVEEDFELVDEEVLDVLVAVTPQQEQALLYRAVPEHDEAYVGTAPLGQCDMKEVQSDLRAVDAGCASVPVTALLRSADMPSQSRQAKSSPGAVVGVACASFKQTKQQWIGPYQGGTCHCQKEV